MKSPIGWVHTTFDKHVDCLTGFAFKSSEYSNDDKDLRLLRGDNIEPGNLRWRDAKYWCNEAENLDKYRLNEGDFVIALDRTWISSGLKVAEVTKADLPCLLVQRVARVRAKPTLEQSLLRQYFSGHRFEQYVKSVQTATAVPHISPNDIKEFPVFLPPLPEQRKIAAILSTWDKAITTTEQLLANSQQQKKALMQQLLKGKKRFNSGVEYDFSVREGFTKGKLGALPNDWKVELINQHLWYQEGPGVRNYQFKTSGVKLFNGTNIQFNQIVLDNTTTFISEDECNGPYKHFLVDDGDLLIACSGISVDRFDEKIAFATHKHLPLCMNTSTMRFKPLSKGRVDIKFFQFFMQSWVFKNQIRRQATGSAQLNFGPSHIGKCYVLIPPLVEQQKIASVLTAADEEISALQQKIEALKQEKKALMQQLLTGKRRVKVDEVAA